ncbi:MAG TPA: hypothetical protein VGG39_20350 [Polyangiaceae bacterium]|jgi:hypothetical protein
MKALNARNVVALLTVGAAALLWNGTANAQNNIVVQPQPAPAPAPVAPPPATVVAPAAPAPQTVVVAPGATEAQPEAAPVAPAPAPEAVGHPINRPNRTLLMTGLVLFGAPYVASIGIAAGSPHEGDSNLYIPVVGPWLDLGARPGCAPGADCGTENGDKALLIGDGILQTVGALEIIGAFVFPETVGVSTVASNKEGQFLSLTPSKVGYTGYGMSAVGAF